MSKNYYIDENGESYNYTASDEYVIMQEIAQNEAESVVIDRYVTPYA